MTDSLLFEIAQVFPHYVVFVEEGKIFMKVNPFEEAELEEVETDYLLTQVATAKGLVKISGFNQEEVLEVADGCAGQYYYVWSGRSAILYIKH